MQPPSHAPPLPGAADLPEVPSGSSRPEGGPEWPHSLARVRECGGRARLRALRDLQAELRGLGAEPSRVEARAERLLSLLKGDLLDGLVGHRGWTARALVVAALLNHGGRWALLLHPEDLQHLREVRARAHPGLRRKTLLILLLSSVLGWSGLVVALSLMAPYYEASPAMRVLPQLLLLYVVALPVVLLLEIIRRRLPWRKQPDVRGVD